MTAGFLTALGLTIADVARGDPSRTAMHWCAGLGAVASLALFTLILRVFGIKLGGLVIGQDERLSTSKLQALLWTYLLLWMLLAIVIANWIGAPGGFNNLINQDLPEEYLILLGGPFAAAIASKAILARKVEKRRRIRTGRSASSSASARRSATMRETRTWATRSICSSTCSQSHT